MKSEDILSLAPPAADQRVAYGKDPNQFVDLRRPKGKPSGSLLFIHGGYWRAKYDLGYAGHLCRSLSDDGWTTINVEYRRVGNEGGGWPGTFSDLRAATQLVFSSAKQWGIDLARLVVMGHSAGGQLAFALAAHESKLRYAVALAGLLDLRRAYELHLSNDAVVEFLGGPPAQVAEHYAEASPIELRVPAKQLVVHGTADGAVPYEISDAYVKRKHKQEDVTFLSLPECGHFEIVDPRTQQWRQIVTVTQKLLAS